MTRRERAAAVSMSLGWLILLPVNASEPGTCVSNRGECVQPPEAGDALLQQPFALSDDNDFYPTTATEKPDGNVCHGKKPGKGWENVPCMAGAKVSSQVLEQAGTNVTKGYQGDFDAHGRVPITEPYNKVGLCPVNVHFHVGTEHLSAGEYDEHGKGPTPESLPEVHHLSLTSAHGSSPPRLGYQCNKYDSHDEKFTKPYDWQHCKDMQVGQTYEVHWPHSSAGACGTPYQYQTPFYDGVFCNDDIVGQMLDGTLKTFEQIGVQAQVFTIVNDNDEPYYDDLIGGMIVDGKKGVDVAKYTGSTTGTSRDNEVCSKYAPITWQVDRKCHLISASSFDKMCGDMKAQRDDMSDDMHPHGARELVDNQIAANNQQ